MESGAPEETVLAQGSAAALAALAETLAARGISARIQSPPGSNMNH